MRLLNEYNQAINDLLTAAVGVSVAWSREMMFEWMKRRHEAAKLARADAEALMIAKGRTAYARKRSAANAPVSSVRMKLKIAFEIEPTGAASPAYSRFIELGCYEHRWPKLVAWVDDLGVRLRSARDRHQSAAAAYGVAAIVCACRRR